MKKTRLVVDCSTGLQVVEEYEQEVIPLPKENKSDIEIIKKLLISKNIITQGDIDVESNK